MTTHDDTGCGRRAELATCRYDQCDAVVILDPERSPQRYGYCSDTCLIESGGLERLAADERLGFGSPHRYQNPDPRCTHRAEGFDYCWSYAHHVDGSCEKGGKQCLDLLAHCRLCDAYAPFAGGQGRSAEDVRADAISWVAVTVGCVLGAIAWGLGAWLWRAMA